MQNIINRDRRSTYRIQYYILNSFAAEPNISALKVVESRQSRVPLRNTDTVESKTLFSTWKVSVNTLDSIDGGGIYIVSFGSFIKLKSTHRLLRIVSEI